MSRDFLLEIGTEELPAGFVDAALHHMRSRAETDLARLRISHGPIETYGTPRRLAMLVRDMADRQADLLKESKGPSKRVAFAEDGTPTRAAEGFARGQGVAVTDLEVRDTDQGEYVYAVTRETGSSATSVLQQWLPGFVTSIPFPKSMRWGEGDLRFARPLRRLVALLGAESVPCSIDGVVAGRTTFGHRFLAPDDISLTDTSTYVQRLRDAYVLVDNAERRSEVDRLVKEAAKGAGGSVVDDGTLIDEVTHLIEYPAAVVGTFDDAYLELPDDVLITPMREHQRYFPLANEDGRLLSKFIAVSNGPRPDLGIVQRGNEKVLAARLADARFFYDEDRKQPFGHNVERLRDVIFQQKLGTVYDKTVRTGALAESIGEDLEVDEGRMHIIREGARLAKADLVTQMVQEFPELQGIMGRDYARLAGEEEDVATVIFEHHLPRHAGDELPKSPAGQIVSIADKIDTIVGCFGVGLIPTGSQDPYALRRQALGVVRIVMDAKLPLHLGRLLERAYDLFSVQLADRTETISKVRDFIRQRLRGVLLEENIRHDVADAIIAADGDRLADVLPRAQALQSFSGESDFAALMTAYERVGNLAGHGEGEIVEPGLFETDAEKGLYEATQTTAAALPMLLNDGSYGEALQLLARLQPAVDKLFDDVMIMAKDAAVRQNRLALLRHTLHLFHAVARFDLIVVARG